MKAPSGFGLDRARGFPSRLLQNHIGECVVATADLPEGTLVERFEGPVVAWGEVPDDEVVYVISFEPHRWLIPRAPARFINHSCEPNCMVRPNGDVVTTRPVSAGAELTIPYDWADAAELARHPDHYFWDPRWSFDCRCGTPGCRGRIAAYRPDTNGSR